MVFHARNKKGIYMTKEQYLQRPTSGVRVRDFDFEDIKVLKRMLVTNKLTDVQRHAILRALSMWRNLE